MVVTVKKCHRICLGMTAGTECVSVAADKPTYSAYVDLHTTFDSLSFPALWLLLARCGTHSGACYYRIGSSLQHYWQIKTIKRQSFLLRPTVNHWLTSSSLPSCQSTSITSLHVNGAPTRPVLRSVTTQTHKQSLFRNMYATSTPEYL